MSILKFFKKQNNCREECGTCTVCGRQRIKNSVISHDITCLQCLETGKDVVSSATKYFFPPKSQITHENKADRNSYKKLSLSSRLSLKRSSNDRVTSGTEKKGHIITDSENNLCAKEINNEDLDGASSSAFDSLSIPTQESLINLQRETPDDDNKKGIPYYLNNFTYIVNNVFQHECDKRLFNENDQEIVQIFNSLSVAGQKLYARLFQRKHKWLRSGKLDYSEIADNVEPVLQELHNRRFLLGSCDIDVESALNLLALPELKNLAKSFQVNIAKKGKCEIINLLQKHCRQNRSVCSSGNITSTLLKSAKQALGTCYKLSNEVRDVFVRILMLFFLTTIVEKEDDASGGFQQELFTLLMVNSGKLVFPEYEIIRKTVLFHTRDDLIMYVNAKHLENKILLEMEMKNFQAALHLYHNAKELYEAYCSQNTRERDFLLPSFLRRFTAGHVYIRCLSHGVDILQRLKDYNLAVLQLEELLEQKWYGGNDRGRWWDRLALNLDQHLKLPVKSMSAIQNGLADEYVQCGHRLNLHNRAKRLCETYSKKYAFNMSNIPEMKITEAPKIVIKGRLLPRTLPGRTHLFISSCSSESLVDGDISVLPVEDLALEHYRSQGYDQGIHGEGSTFITLFCLFFWDQIYSCKVPDAFHRSHQTHPLDLNSDYFYKSRKLEIDQRLKQLEECSVEELVEIGKELWTEHEGKTCLAQWDNFDGWQQADGLIRCLGNKVIVGICRRLAQNFRFCRSGGPDLVVWNPKEFFIKFVEVKGPGDQLSPKQVLWLDYLLSLGADAEVCYIEAVSSKQLKK